MTMPIHSLTDLWDQGATTFYGIKMNVTDSASEADSKLIELQIGGSAMFYVGKAGQGWMSDETAFYDPSDNTKMVRLDAGDLSTGETRVVTVPDSDTTLLSTTGDQSLSPAEQGQVRANIGATGIVLGTPIATTSGTAISITGIPAGTKRVTIHFMGVSTSGTSGIVLIIGPGTGFETSGYNSAGGQVFNSSATVVTLSTGAFRLSPIGTSTAATLHGSAVFLLADASTNTWVLSGVLGRDDQPGIVLAGGSKALAGALNRVRLASGNGTDTFDAGSISISYE